MIPKLNSILESYMNSSEELIQARRSANLAMIRTGELEDLVAQLEGQLSNTSADKAALEAKYESLKEEAAQARLAADDFKQKLADSQKKLEASVNEFLLKKREVDLAQAKVGAVKRESELAQAAEKKEKNLRMEAEEKAKVGLSKIAELTTRAEAAEKALSLAQEELKEKASSAIQAYKISEDFKQVVTLKAMGPVRSLASEVAKELRQLYPDIDPHKFSSLVPFLKTKNKTPASSSKSSAKSAQPSSKE